MKAHFCSTVAEYICTLTDIYNCKQYVEDIHSPKGLLGTPVQFLINAII